MIAAAACGSDKPIVGPDQGECVKGQLSIGGTATGVLSSASCPLTDTIVSDNDTYYDSYTFQASAGKAYQITARAPDQNTDYVLYLMGFGASQGQEVELGASDDDGQGLGGVDPQMTFIAPESGVYSVRVMGYSNADTNSYTLTARECPVRGTIATSFSDANQQLQQSDCVVAGYLPGADSSRVALYSVHMDAGTTREITVVSSAFTPGFLIGGPGFDAMCWLDGCSSTGVWNGTDSVTTTFTAENSGDYTLGVGSSSGYSTLGTFKLVVGAAQPATRRAFTPLASRSFFMGSARKSNKR